MTPSLSASASTVLMKKKEFMWKPHFHLYAWNKLFCTTRRPDTSKVKVFTVQNGHTQRWGEKPFCHRERPDVMNQTNGHTLLKSLSSEAFMVLHSVLHTKSGEGNGVKNEKWERKREVQTLPSFSTPSKGGFTHCETIQQALPLKHTEALTLTDLHRIHLLCRISKVKNKQQLHCDWMKYVIK